MPSDDLLVTEQRNILFNEGTDYGYRFYDVNSQVPDPSTVWILLYNI
jgi:hypothetical protein